MIKFSTLLVAEAQHVVGVMLSWLVSLSQGSFAALGNLFNSPTT